MKDGKKVVITYGTFDLFHKGHYNILKRTKELGDYLIVGVTGETYDIERGKLSVKDSLVKRIENVNNTGFADLIIVEEYLGQKIQDIIKYGVDLLVVGSDWIGKFDHMNKYCEVKYLERTKDISSTLIRENSSAIKKLGIVTDDLYDDEIIIESKYVSGIHAESVYSEDESVAEKFCKKYELDKQYTGLDDFFSSVDIVYIRTSGEKKADIIRMALENNKTVLSSPMISDSPDVVAELYEIASKTNNVLVECITTFYLQAFVQLLWNAKGNVIGDVFLVKNGFRMGGLAGINEKRLKENIYFSILVAEEFFGKNIDFSLNTIKKEKQEYCVLIGKGEDGIYLSELGVKQDVKYNMEIIGTEGKIVVPEDWWYTGYFELHKNNDNGFKRYSWNFDGNGMRYVLMAILPKDGAIPTSTDVRVPTKEIINAINIADSIL